MLDIERRDFFSLKKLIHLISIQIIQKEFFMNKYIVNKNAQSNGDHEVHNETFNCQFLPNYENRRNLGYHSNCHNAVSEAKKYYGKVNGCFYCANNCHTT